MNECMNECMNEGKYLKLIEEIMLGMGIKCNILPLWESQSSDKCFDHVSFCCHTRCVGPRYQWSDC